VIKNISRNDHNSYILDGTTDVKETSKLSVISDTNVQNNFRFGGSTRREIIWTTPRQHHTRAWIQDYSWRFCHWYT